ncbi:MAG: MaoC family dehydratase, partial [Deltaproteobacteria bacterium]|nr:MaoC family dehydratase [Deltaproteobacteria bacterium]
MGITDVLITELKKNIGQETGLSDWFEITQERVDAFAEAIEDRQW